MNRQSKKQTVRLTVLLQSRYNYSKTEKMKLNSIEEAITKFEESAIIQGQTQETGDYKKGNKYHKLEMQCVVYLSSINLNTNCPATLLLGLSSISKLQTV